jgi:hypothetical protein
MEVGNVLDVNQLKSAKMVITTVNRTTYVNSVTANLENFMARKVTPMMSNESA